MIDFSTWTREDFTNFDLRRQEVFQPTPEEIAEQELQAKINLINRTKPLLQQYWIVFTWEETDFTNLYTEYISWTPDMKERLGADLQSKVDYYSTYHNNLNDFCDFVIKYESF